MNMAFSINTNAGALFALQSLNNTNRGLDQVQSRINTGLKVASAKDNAAVFAIAQKQRAELSGLSAVNSSLNAAKSSIDVALAAGEAVSDLLIQLREKATAAADPSAATADKVKYNDEYTQLVAQIDSVVNNAEFNGQNAVNGTDSINALIALPDGTNTAGDYSLTIAAVDIGADSSGLALTATSLTGTSAGSALAAISTAQDTVTGFLSKLGAGAKRVDIQQTFTNKLADAIEIGVGNLVDADLAKESAKLQALQVKQQLGLQALSIANQAPGSVISLFR
jgi:flagellin